MSMKPIVSGTPPINTDVDQIRLALSGAADVGALSLCAPQATPTAATVAAGAAGALTGAYSYREVLLTGFKQGDGSYWVNGLAPTPPWELFGLSDVTNASSVAVDSSGYVYAAYAVSVGTKNVRKLNSSGTEVWSLTDIGQASCIAVDASGNVYVAYNNGSGTTVRKLDYNGTQVWAKSDVFAARGIAVDASGNVYVAYANAAGSKNVRKLNSSGTEVWSLTDVGSANGIAVDGSGNVYVAYVNAAGTKNVRKLNSSGAEVWALTDVGYANGIAVDSSGNVYVAYSNSVGTKNVRKLNSSGTEVWSLTDVGYATGIAVDGSGNVLVAYQVNTLGKPVRKLNSSGAEVWYVSDYGYASWVAVGSTGTIYVAYNSAVGKTVRAISSAPYVILSSQKANLSSIPLGAAGCIGRAIYRTAAGGAPGTERFCGIIWDNTTTTFVDNRTDQYLGTGVPDISSSPAAYGTSIPAICPSSNTTGTSLSLPPWKTDFIPAVSGITLGNGTITFEYEQVGKTFRCIFQFTMGSLSAVTGAISFTVPVTLKYARNMPAGSVFDSNPGVNLVCAGLLSGNTCFVSVYTVSGSYIGLANFSSTVPMTWAVGDVLTIGFESEVA